MSETAGPHTREGSSRGGSRPRGGVALQGARGARALGVLSFAFLALVALAVVWFQLRRAAERSRAERQGRP